MTFTALGLFQGKTSQPKQTDIVEDALFKLSHRFGGGFWREPPSSKFGNDWAAENPDSSPAYVKVMTQVQKRFGKGDTSQVVENLMSDALKAKDDPKALFAWAYGASLEAALEAKQGKAYWFNSRRFQEHGILEWLLASAPQPKSLEFNRIRYLTEAGLLNRPDLTPFARRLLVNRQMDAPVMRTLAFQLANSNKERDLKDASDIADRLLASDPENLGAVGLKSHIYQARWMRLGYRRADGLATIKWYEKYISLAPKGSPNSKGAAEGIKFVQKIMSERE